MPSLFGIVREWLGPEGVLFAFYDAPGIVEALMDLATEFIIKLCERVLKRWPVDKVLFWEDMAYNSGSLISPELVAKFMVPRYRKITNLFHDCNVPAIFVDCDGQMDKLIPLWLEAGINGVMPLEIRAGMNPLQLRTEYGHRLLLWGGIDKKALTRGPVDIQKELESKIPLLAHEGGYLATLDHAVPPEVSLENYLYYAELKKTLITGVSPGRVMKVE